MHDLKFCCATPADKVLYAKCSHKSSPQLFRINWSFDPIGPKVDPKMDPKYFPLKLDPICSKSVILARSTQNASSTVRKRVSHLEDRLTSDVDVDHCCAKSSFLVFIVSFHFVRARIRFSLGRDSAAVFVTPSLDLVSCNFSGELLIELVVQNGR